MLEFHLIANSKWFLSPLVGNGFHIVEEKYFIFFPHFACKSATPNSEKIENTENQRFFHDTGESSVLHEHFLVLKVADDIFFPFFFFLHSGDFGGGYRGWETIRWQPWKLLRYFLLSVISVFCSFGSWSKRLSYESICKWIWEIHSISFFFVLSYCDLLLFPEAY